MPVLGYTSITLEAEVGIGLLLTANLLYPLWFFELVKPIQLNPNVGFYYSASVRLGMRYSSIIPVEKWRTESCRSCFTFTGDNAGYVSIPRSLLKPVFLRQKGQQWMFCNRQQRRTPIETES